MKYDLNIEIDLKSAQTRFKTLLDRKVCIDMVEIKNKRTTSQNAYLHVCITLFGIEYGYTLEESKTTLKRLCPFMRYKKKDNVFLKQTSKMNTKELTEFIEWIRNYAAYQGSYIPTADEYLSNKFQIDREIDKHKKYL